MHLIESLGPGAPLALLLVSHFIVSCGLVWRALQDGRHADAHWQDARRWQALAEGLLRRQRTDAAPTVIAPAWHAPRFDSRPASSTQR